MAQITIDPASFRDFVNAYARSDEVKAKVETMSDATIVDLVERNLDYDDIMAAVNEAENVSLTQLETEYSFQ